MHRKSNKIDIVNDIAVIELKADIYTTIDVADLQLVGEYAWHASRKKKNGPYYAARNKFINGKWTMVSMSRVVLDVGDPNVLVDHINGDTLDNTRLNLRTASRSQNAYNSKPKKGLLKGVSFNKHLISRPWRAAITINGVKKHLGYFSTSDEAIAVYKRFEAEHFGEFAYYESRRNAA